MLIGDESFAKKILPGFFIDNIWQIRVASSVLNTPVFIYLDNVRELMPISLANVDIVCPLKIIYSLNDVVSTI